MRFVALGDSLTAGSGAGSAGSWAKQLADRWRAQGRTVAFRNLAVSGYTTQDLLTREVPQIADGAGVFSVAIGTNDVSHGTPASTYQNQLREVFTALSRKGVSGPQVFAIPQPNWSNTYDGRRRGSARVLALIEAYNDALQYETLAFGGRYVDLWPLMLRQAAAGMWSSGVHPSAAAYTAWADACARELAGWEALEAPTSTPAPPSTPVDGGGTSRAFRWYGFLADRLGLVAHPLTRDTAPRAEPLSPAAVFAAHPDVTTLVCGPMFGGSDTRPVLIRRYLDTAAGINVQGSHTDGHTLCVVDGEAVVLPGNRVAPGARVAVGLPFAMVQDGRDTWPEVSERDTTWRAAVGILSDKRLIFALGDSGLQAFTDAALAANYGPGVSLRFLGYLDGGHEGQIAQKLWRWGASPAPAPGFLVERGGSATPMPPRSSASSPEPGAGGGGGGGRPRPTLRTVARASPADGWGAYLAAGIVGAVAGTSPLWLPPLVGWRTRKR